MLQAFQADGPQGWEAEQELGKPGGQETRQKGQAVPAAALPLPSGLGRGGRHTRSLCYRPAVGLHPEPCREISLERGIHSENELGSELEG